LTCSCSDAYRVPAYSPEAIAEHAITLILCLSRKINEGQKRIKTYNFSLDDMMGFNLSNKTVGVIGTGKIGKALIKILKGFGSKILTHDILIDEELNEDPKVNYVSKEKLLQDADIVSLNIPLNKYTHHYINFNEIDLMKKNSILINTARGGILNTQALIYGIKSEKLSFAGIDVYENEENYFFKDCSNKVLDDELLKILISCPKILITGHQAFFTETAINNIIQTTFQNIVDFSKGESSDNFLC